MLDYPWWKIFGACVTVLVGDGLIPDCMVKCLSTDRFACCTRTRGSYLRISVSLVFGDLDAEARDDSSSILFGLSIGLRMVCRVVRYLVSKHPRTSVMNSLAIRGPLLAKRHVKMLDGIVQWSKKMFAIFVIDVLDIKIALVSFKYRSTIGYDTYVLVAFTCFLQLSKYIHCNQVEAYRCWKEL